MDRTQIIVKLTTLEAGYLALAKRCGEAEDRLKTLETSERSWALWYAKLGMLPVVASFALVIASVAMNVKTSARTDAMIKAAERIVGAIPKDH